VVQEQNFAQHSTEQNTALSGLMKNAWVSKPAYFGMTRLFISNMWEGTASKGR